jgi:hypothetical protein
MALCLSGHSAAQQRNTESQSTKMTAARDTQAAAAYRGLSMGLTGPSKYPSPVSIPRSGTQRQRGRRTKEREGEAVDLRRLGRC